MTRDEVAKSVYRTINEIIPNALGLPTSTDLSLTELGADSVDKVEIILLIKERLAPPLSMSDMNDPTNIESLIDLIHNALAMEANNTG